MDGAFSLEQPSRSSAGRAHAHRAGIKMVSNLLGRILPAVFLHFAFETSRLHPSSAARPRTDFRPFAHGDRETPALAASSGLIAVFTSPFCSARIYPTFGATFFLRKRGHRNGGVRHRRSDGSGKPPVGLFWETCQAKRPSSPARRGLRSAHPSRHHGGLFHCAVVS